MARLVRCGNHFIILDGLGGWFVCQGPLKANLSISEALSIETSKEMPVENEEPKSNEETDDVKTDEEELQDKQSPGSHLLHREGDTETLVRSCWFRFPYPDRGCERCRAK